MTAITNLVCRFTYPRYATNLPVVLLVHGFVGDATSFGDTALLRMANRGLFIASVGMRGRNSASGSQDASGREIYDIYDCLTYIRTNYSANVSSTIAAVVGYSGGGGNALAAACKFPDTWSVVVSHFGMSDYGRNGTHGWYYNNPGEYTAGISSWVGGVPGSVPNRYYARDATAGIRNYSGGHLYLFHDSADTDVPIVHSQRITDALDAQSLTNYTESYTGASDSIRWIHGYPLTGQPLAETEQVWANAIKSGRAWTVAAAGTVTVLGYIVTKRFTIWLNANGTATTGIDAAAIVEYDTDTDTYTVTPLTTGGIDVSITQGAKTGSATNISTDTVIVVT